MPDSGVFISWLTDDTNSAFRFWISFSLVMSLSTATRRAKRRSVPGRRRPKSRCDTSHDTYVVSPWHPGASLRPYAAWASCGGSAVDQQIDECFAFDQALSAARFAVRGIYIEEALGVRIRQDDFVISIDRYHGFGQAVQNRIALLDLPGAR